MKKTKARTGHRLQWMEVAEIGIGIRTAALGPPWMTVGFHGRQKIAENERYGPWGGRLRMQANQGDGDGEELAR